MSDRGELLLDAIQEEVSQRINFGDGECWHCGGEGYTYDCFEEYACVDPEGGCEDCARRCPECAELKRDRLKAVREEVIKMNDVDVARAWLKSIGRWRDDITDERIMADLAKAAASVASTDNPEHSNGMD